MIDIPRTIFQEEHEIFRQSVRRFIEAEIAPHHDDWERAGEVPAEVWKKVGDAGILCPAMSDDFGGGGGDFLHSSVVIEELARVGATGPCFALHSDVIAPYLINFGSEQLKQKWLPKMAAGIAPGAIAMTEPGGGSDVQSIATRAVRDGNDWVLNGQKVYISNARPAAFIIVACKTGDEISGGKGLSLILVETDRPGFDYGRRFEKIGSHAQDLSELFFNECRIPAENLIGNEGEGFFHLMKMLPQERLVQAVRAVSSCEAMLEWTIEFVKTRKAFGRPIAGFQNTSFRLAELYSDILAQRVLVDRCLELHIAGNMGTTLAAALKMTTTELQGRVADACLQMFGAAGYMKETPIARAFIDARQTRIAGGTVEIMKHIVGRALLKD